MGRGKLTPEEIKILSKNPNVVSVNEDRIVYSDAFKKHFVEHYFMGEWREPVIDGHNLSKPVSWDFTPIPVQLMNMRLKTTRWLKLAMRKTLTPMKK